MLASRPRGIARAKRLRVSADGSTKDVGNLEVVAGLRLTGPVVLPDGAPVQPPTRLHAGRDNAWDSLGVELDPQGRFDLQNLPPESYGLSLRVRGYTMSPANRSLDRLNGDSLVGRVDRDTDVSILLEPGQFARPDFQKLMNSGVEPQPKEKLLQGADAVNALRPRQD